MATLPTPSPLVGLDDCDMPVDVVDAVALQTFASGVRPWARTVRIDRSRAEATLLPEEATVVLEATDQYRRVVLATVDGATIWASRWTDGRSSVTVLADDASRGDEVLAAATDGAAEPVDEDDLTVAEVGFWHQGRHGPVRRVRTIPTPAWTSIRPNYGASVARAIDALVDLAPDRVDGRLLLLHGPPGTGKTTALRSLAGAWRSWCHFDYVVDPDRLLDDPAYLMGAALDGDGDNGDSESARRWRLLLLEDCDELIRAGAKKAAGQRLSRLLNLTDGLLGQGLDLIVAITTNEPLDNLHPAVVRPGRCIAQIEVGPLSAAEAGRWLGRPLPVGSGPLTLASLYARKGELHTVAHRDEPVAAGMYL